MSSRHQFHLRWSNYGHNLANSFVRLFESESLADVTLFCEGESYRAHRVVLAASSVHFQELFEQCSSAQNLVVILDGTSPANLRALLEFMYKGEVYIDDANLNTFLQTAKRLQVKGLSLSQSDLHSISHDANDERGPVGQDGKGPGGTSVVGSENLLAQALGPQQNSQGQPKSNNVQSSPPNSFSSPSPSQTPPHPQTNNQPSGLYGDDKHRKKFRLSSPKHASPEGNIPEGIEYSHTGGHTGGHSGGHHSHPPRPSAPAPSPNINSRMIEMDQQGNRTTMVPGFPAFAPIYPTSQLGQLGPPPSPQSHSQQQHSQSQQQTIVITENPNIRKVRSASTENTMPEDLSIKLEVGRDEELSGMTGKQRSFSMDLSPSDPLPFGGMSGGGGPGPSNVWSLPSPSGLQHVSVTSHDINLNNAQSTPDGKLMNGKKLKCPFCERLYGYETNLRAHIRQRHQGIRVPCPFCTRTFTRNNTVRRHVAREHRALLGGVRAFNHPLDPGGPGQGQFSLQGQGQGQGPGLSTASSPSQGSPNPNTRDSLGHSGQSNSSNSLIGMSGGQLMLQQQSGGGGHVSQSQHTANMQHMMNSGASAAAVAAAVAAAAANSNSNQQQQQQQQQQSQSPPLSSSGSGSGGSIGGGGGRPSSRSSIVGGPGNNKPSMD